MNASNIAAYAYALQNVVPLLLSSGAAPVSCVHIDGKMQMLGTETSYANDLFAGIAQRLPNHTCLSRNSDTAGQHNKAYQAQMCHLQCRKRLLCGKLL